MAPTLCALVRRFAARVGGVVAYDDDGFSLAFALTLAGQQRLLPATAAVLAKHGCLRDLAVGRDLRGQFPDGRLDAWRWALAELLPGSSKTVAFNRFRFPGTRPAPPAGAAVWGPATLIDVDFAVQQNAFVMDFAVDCVGKPDVTSCPYDADARLIDGVFARYGTFGPDFHHFD